MKQDLIFHMLHSSTVGTMFRKGNCFPKNETRAFKINLLTTKEYKHKHKKQKNKKSLCRIRWKNRQTAKKTKDF
jgi:hypothetical protein